MENFKSFVACGALFFWEENSSRSRNASSLYSAFKKMSEELNQKECFMNSFDTIHKVYLRLKLESQ